MKTKVRSVYIDVMKGLLITLVVIGHLQFFEYDSRTLTLIYSFHMPAFLIIGGILSHINERSRFLDILAKRVRGTLVPYFVFYLISMIFIPVATWELRIEAIKCVFTGIGDPRYAINLPLWFLTFYFSAMLIFETIEYIAYKMKVSIYGYRSPRGNQHILFVHFVVFLFITIIMWIAFWYARIYKGPRLPYNVEIACFCLGFVWFGKIIGTYVPEAIDYIKKNTALTVFFFIIAIIIIFALIFVWYFFSMRNGRIDLNARDYKNAFLMYFDAIIGFIIFAYFALIATNLPIIKDAFAIFGENSIYILAYHVPSAIITQCFIIPFLPIVLIQALSVNSIFSVTILTLLGIFFSLIMGLFHRAIHFP